MSDQGLTEERERILRSYAAWEKRGGSVRTYCEIPCAYDELFSEIDRLRAELNAVTEDLRSLQDFMGELDLILKCPAKQAKSATSLLEDTARERMSQLDIVAPWGNNPNDANYFSDGAIDTLIRDAPKDLK